MKRKALKAKPIELPDIPCGMTGKEKKRHRKLGKQFGMTWRDSSQLYRDLQGYREDAWRETVRAFEANPGSFSNAWHYLNNHPVFWTFGDVRDGKHPEVRERNLQHEYGMTFGCGIEVTVNRVDPKTRRISDDPALNTRTEVWYEVALTHWPTDPHYPIRIHDYECDGGAKTYEKAIVKAARKIHQRYGNDRQILDAEPNKEPEVACGCPAHQKARETLKPEGKGAQLKAALAPLIEAAPGWTGCQECYSFGCNAAVCRCGCHPKAEGTESEPTVAEALAEPDYNANLAAWERKILSEEPLPLGSGRPNLTSIIVNTRTPDKWRFVDTETQEVWRWEAGSFKLVDPQADAEELALLNNPDFMESLAQMQRGEGVPATTLIEEGADWQTRAEEAEAAVDRIKELCRREFNVRAGYQPAYEKVIEELGTALNWTLDATQGEGA